MTISFSRLNIQNNTIDSPEKTSWAIFHFDVLDIKLVHINLQLPAGFY
jgi:hypothetical protein